MKTDECLGLKGKSKYAPLQNQKGQFLIESVLLLVVLLGVFMLVSNYVRDKQLLSKLVEGPMRNVSAMVAFGTWRADGCTAPGRARQTIGKCHPNSISRSLSSDPSER